MIKCVVCGEEIKGNKILIINRSKEEKPVPICSPDGLVSIAEAALFLSEMEQRKPGKEIESGAVPYHLINKDPLLAKMKTCVDKYITESEYKEFHITLTTRGIYEEVYCD